MWPLANSQLGTEGRSPTALQKLISAKHNGSLEANPSPVETTYATPVLANTLIAACERP